MGVIIHVESFGFWNKVFVCLVRKIYAIQYLRFITTWFWLSFSINKCTFNNVLIVFDITVCDLEVLHPSFIWWSPLTSIVFLFYFFQKKVIWHSRDLHSTALNMIRITYHACVLPLSPAWLDSIKGVTFIQSKYNNICTTPFSRRNKNLKSKHNWNKDKYVEWFKFAHGLIMLITIMEQK